MFVTYATLTRCIQFYVFCMFSLLDGFRFSLHDQDVVYKWGCQL